MANAIFGHLRAHMNLQSRSGHPGALPATIQLADGVRAIDLATENHPYFLNMPIWRPPGFMTGRQISEDFGAPARFTYWYLPPNLRNTIGLRDGDIARIIDTSPPHNLKTFARGLAKIGYCNAVMKYGLDGFRPLVIADIILGKYPNVAYFVGSDPTRPSPPYKRGIQHSVALGSINYSNIKFLTATIVCLAIVARRTTGCPPTPLSMALKASAESFPNSDRRGRPAEYISRTTCN
jgi:hypothetical protein